MVELYPEVKLKSELEELYVESHRLGSDDVQRNNTGGACNMSGIVVGLMMALASAVVAVPCLLYRR